MKNQIMEFPSKKLMLIRMILDIEDVELLDSVAVKIVRWNEPEQEEMIWTKHDQAMLEQSRQEFREGKGIPHEEVKKEMAIYRQELIRKIETKKKAES